MYDLASLGLSRSGGQRKGRVFDRRKYQSIKEEKDPNSSGDDTYGAMIDRTYIKESVNKNQKQYRQCQKQSNNVVYSSKLQGIQNRAQAKRREQLVNVGSRNHTTRNQGPGQSQDSIHRTHGVNCDSRYQRAAILNRAEILINSLGSDEGGSGSNYTTSPRVYATRLSNGGMSTNITIDMNSSDSEDEFYTTVNSVISDSGSDTDMYVLSRNRSLPTHPRGKVRRLIVANTVAFSYFK